MTFDMPPNSFIPNMTIKNIAIIMPWVGISDYIFFKPPEKK